MTPTPTPTSDAAIQRYKIGYHADEWGQRSSTPSGIPDASGSWVRYADHVTALAAGQATAAQAAPATQQAAEREQERIAFKDAHRHLELYEVPDAWGRPMFKHYPVEARWLGWIARASHGQAPAGVTLRSMIEGMSVSVDVSTGDHDAGHRYFGTVTEVMECQGNKHGVTLLVQDAEPNFTATPTAPSTPSSTAQQASAHVLHLVHSAFAEIAMAFPKAFALHKVGIADTAVRKALAAYTPQAADSVQEDAGRIMKWSDRIQRVHPKSEPEFWPDALRVKYMADEISDLRAAIDAVRKQGGVNG